MIAAEFLAIGWAFAAASVIFGMVSRFVAGPPFHRGWPAWALLGASGVSIFVALVMLGVAIVDLVTQ